MRGSRCTRRFSGDGNDGHFGRARPGVVAGGERGFRGGWSASDCPRGRQEVLQADADGVWGLVVGDGLLDRGGLASLASSWTPCESRLKSAADATDLWSDCLGLTTGSLLGEEADFLLRMDNFYAETGAGVKGVLYYNTLEVFRPSVGFSGLLDIVGHFEEELRVSGSVAGGERGAGEAVRPRTGRSVGKRTGLVRVDTSQRGRVDGRRVGNSRRVVRIPAGLCIADDGPRLCARPLHPRACPHPVLPRRALPGPAPA